jgi:hypothetical protein
VVVIALPAHLEAKLAALKAMAPVDFDKETARAVIGAVVAAIDDVVASASKQIVGNMLLGGDDGIHTDRNQQLLILVATLWEAKSEILYCLDRIAESPFDDVPARVCRVNDCIRIDPMPASLPIVDRAEQVNEVQRRMYHAFLTRPMEDPTT